MLIRLVKKREVKAGARFAEAPQGVVGSGEGLGITFRLASKGDWGASRNFRLREKENI